MTQRVAKKDMARTLANYAATLAGAGFMSEDDAARITWAAPYGQVSYVVTRAESHGYDHKVPGFWGSGGSGFVSLREGRERVMQSMRTVQDVIEAVPYDYEKAERVRAAVLAAHGVSAFDN